MESKPYTDTEVDFSKPITPQPTPEQPQENEASVVPATATISDPRITEIKSAKFTKKTLILIIIFVVLAIIQGVIIYLNIPKKTYPKAAPKAKTTQPKTTKPKTTKPKTTKPKTKTTAPATSSSTSTPPATTSTTTPQQTQ